MYWSNIYSCRFTVSWQIWGGVLWADECDFIAGLVRFAVPCFLMLSGKYLLSDGRNASLVYFVKKAISRLIIPVLFISIFAICYSELNTILTNSGSLISPFVKWLQGRPFYHLWYVYTLIGIYLIVPAIVNIRANVSIRTYYCIGILWFIAACISSQYCDFQLAWGVHTVSCFGSWLIVGDLIGRLKRNVNPVFCLVLGIAMLILTGVWDVLQNHIADVSLMDRILGYVDASDNFSPTVIIASISIFTGFKNLNGKHKWGKVASKTFYLYLIHAFVIDIIVKLYNIVFKNTPNPWLWIPVCVVITFIMSYVGSYLFDAVLKLFEKVLYKIWLATRFTKET